ncbi:dTDP-4-dehydrorhamnose reductase [Vibrio aestuarianus]|nr:dTDP-4-dehydrorhamnose reductase [Vibrio aestuarianus]
MKVIVTGSQGQVGKRIVELLNLRSDINVFPFTRNDLDITNENQVNEVLGFIKPDVVINSAAYTAVERAESEERHCYAINRDGAKNLAVAVNLLGALLLHISTDYVFDGTQLQPYKESDVAAPKNVYGKSKLAGEIAIAEHCDRYAILRTAWVFDENGNNFVKTMLNLGRRKNSLDVVCDQIGGPTYSLDIASTLIIMMDYFIQKSSTPSGIYHYSGLPHVSWHEFACTIFDVSQRKNIISELPKINKIKAEQYPSLVFRPKNSCMNCDLIEEVFNIKPSNWYDALENIENYIL